MIIPAKQAGIWALWDFATSFAGAVFAIYFSQWLVIDHHVSDLNFNLIFVVSSLLLIPTAPVLGVYVDKIRVKLPALRATTICTFIFLVGISLLAQFARPTGTVVFLVLVGLIAAQYFFQLSFVFYNPLLGDVGDTDDQARISGLGEGAASLGHLSGLLLTLPLATGVLYFFGHHDESQVFLPSAVIFMALTLPMLLYFKERSKPVKAEGFHIAEEVKNLAHHFRGLKRFPGVIRFLFAMFFFNDAVLTAADNFPIYIHRVFNVNEQAKVFLLASVLIMTGVGAIASGYIVPQGGKKKLLLVLLASWVVLLPITALQKHLIPFIICMTLVGLLLGATGAVARTVMIYLSPREELTHIFAYYSMTARLASFLGPLTWGLITLAFRGHGHVKYQVALAAMAVFVWIGYLLVRSIPEENELQAI